LKINLNIFQKIFIKIEICSDLFHESKSVFFLTQVSCLSIATHWENHMRIDFFEHSINSIILSSHRLFLNSTNIDSIVDISNRVVDFYIYESFSILKCDSWTWNVFSMLISSENHFLFSQIKHITLINWC
jgi:hypothetical protein